MNFLPGYSQQGNVFNEPIVPTVSGYQFLKFAGVAFIGIWLLKNLGSAFSSSK